MLKQILKSIRTNTLVGLILITPVVATVLIFKFLFGLTTGWMPVVDKWQGTRFEVPMRLLVLLVLLAMLYLVGLLVRNVLGKRLYQLGDKLLAGLPLIKGIYVAVRQISEALFTQRKTLFQEVVMIEYPRKGLHSVAFVTSIVPPDLAANMTNSDADGESLTLFVPTTPNPTSGILIIVPRSETRPLAMPVSEALTFVMSAGAVVPGKKGVAVPTLLDKLEAWVHKEDQDSQVPADVGS